MALRVANGILDEMKSVYPQKFVSEEEIFRHIPRGDRIFIHTACGEPQYLVQALIRFVESNPKAFFDAEVIHVWTLGVAPYTDEKFKYNFRHNSFFVGNNSREAVNRGSLIGTVTKTVTSTKHSESTLEGVGSQVVDGLNKESGWGTRNRT